MSQRANDLLMCLSICVAGHGLPLQGDADHRFFFFHPPVNPASAGLVVAAICHAPDSIYLHRREINVLLRATENEAAQVLGFPSRVKVDAKSEWLEYELPDC